MAASDLKGGPLAANICHKANGGPACKEGCWRCNPGYVRAPAFPPKTGRFCGTFTSGPCETGTCATCYRQPTDTPPEKETGVILMGKKHKPDCDVLDPGADAYECDCPYPPEEVHVGDRLRHVSKEEYAVLGKIKATTYEVRLGKDGCGDFAIVPQNEWVPWSRPAPCPSPAQTAGVEAVSLEAAQKAISDECDAMKEFLLGKNQKYGNSAFQPINVMSRLSPLEGIKLRIDDKLKRMQMGDGTATEDTVKDLAGYYILHGAAKRLGL